MLPSPDISRQHAQVTLVGDQALLTDLGATNGTRLDGQRIAGAVKLEPGARLVLFRDGAFEMRDPMGANAGSRRCWPCPPGLSCMRRTRRHA